MIIISRNNNEERLVLPIHPLDVGPDIQSAHEEFETFRSGSLLLYKPPGLRVLTIDSFFPEYAKKYTFQERMSLDGKDYLAYLNKWMASNIPLRVKVITKDEVIVNMPCMIAGFTYAPDKAGDIKYSLSLKEYKVVR